MSRIPLTCWATCFSKQYGYEVKASDMSEEVNESKLKSHDGTEGHSAQWNFLCAASLVCAETTAPTSCNPKVHSTANATQRS